MSGVWRKCAGCAKEIHYGKAYQSCSISSCRKSVFCSVDCWDVHSTTYNHKNAWAEENRAPMESSGEDRPRRRIVSSPSGSNSSKTISGNGNVPNDILVVVSKFKAYVKAKHDLNTSGDVAEIVSEYIRQEVDRAVVRAREDGRKTLMAKDF